MEITTRLKKRFCKDFAIPIKIYKEPYWTERLELFDKKFNTKLLWKKFCLELEQFNNEEEYFAEYNKFKDSVINHIKDNPLYADFNSFDMKNTFTIPHYQFGRKSVFKEDNIGKTLVSIDLTSGNFSAMKYFNKKLVDGYENYYDFISQFTDIGTFKSSKYIRQVIFGALNPKRQVKIEHFMMNYVMVELLRYVDEKYIQSFMSDEIIFEWSDDVVNNSGLQLSELLHPIINIALDNGFIIHSDTYELQKIEGTDSYIQYKHLDRFDLKCVNPNYYPLILKNINQEAVTESDLVFYHDHRLCRFLEEPEIKIGEKVGLYIL